MMDRPTDLAAKIRSSVVSVVSPTGRGSGYCALSNGLIVTSLDVVRYEREVQIMHDDGAPIRALVVRANVALDVALLVPVEPVSISPLEAGAEARIGDFVLVVGRAGAEPIVVQSHVISTGRVCEGFAHIQLDVTCEDSLRGAPVVNKHGGVIGFVVRPRVNRINGDRHARRSVHGLVLPSAAFEGGLISAEGSPEELLELLPEYGCPSCDTIFEPDMDRCVECGTLLPHRWLVASAPPAPPSLKGLFAVKAALASLGIPANRARVGPNAWRFSPAIEGQDANTQVDLGADAAGDNLVLRAPVVRLPAEGFEHVYRHLLTQNDATAGYYRFGIADRTVYLSLFEPTSALDPASFPTLVSEFASTLARYRAFLHEGFGVEPAYEHETD